MLWQVTKKYALYGNTLVIAMGGKIVICFNQFYAPLRVIINLINP